MLTDVLTFSGKENLTHELKKVFKSLMAIKPGPCFPNAILREQYCACGRGLTGPGLIARSDLNTFFKS